MGIEDCNNYNNNNNNNNNNNKSNLKLIDDILLNKINNL